MAVGPSANDTSYYTALAAALNEQVFPLYRTTITLLQYPSQGDFYWVYQNSNNVFNAGTFNYISARVLPGDASGLAQLSPAGGFSNAYLQLLSGISFTLSTSDQNRYDAAVRQAQGDGNELVQSYERTFGVITEQDMSEAQNRIGTTAVSTHLDYIVSYILGYLWSGREKQQRPCLLYSQMAAASDLAALLPQMPASGPPIVMQATSYIAQMAQAGSILDKLSSGGWLLHQLQNSTAHPDSANGGMVTINPNDGSLSTGCQVGYTISSALATIQNSLQDSDRIIRVTIAGPQGGTVTISYPGHTIVPVAPTAWQQATNVGWFDPDPIAEAYQNGDEDVTGFKFSSPPAFNLGPLDAGGDFGQLVSLLICNPPTVTVSARTDGDSTLNAAPTQTADDVLSAFSLLNLGLPGSAEYETRLISGSRNGEPVIRVAPVGGATIPQLQQTAYVIGACVDFPTADATPRPTSTVERMIAEQI